MPENWRVFGEDVFPPGNIHGPFWFVHIAINNLNGFLCFSCCLAAWIFHLDWMSDGLIAGAISAYLSVYAVM
jgi:hypothetical protein